MLVMAWPPWYSIGAQHWLGTQKTYLRSICLHYQQYLILNRHFLSFLNNAAGITIFILCCISAYLPGIEAERRRWEAVIDDLHEIKYTSDSIDACLYTAYTDKPDECEVQVMECFLLELKVISHECEIRKGCKIKQYVRNVLANVKANLPKNTSLPTSLNRNKITCKQCEEYEERNFIKFIETFEEFAKHKLKFLLHIPK
ncbi:interleukin-15 isoform X5 [Gopherus flavomarginatus]|nr:interleukin-15 isoform X5 [Gopherus flavomarginatus]XP_050802625.1 interleukin-15 isoform X5 [Gopherus flavomarginatus]XP_050802626.1 interleukin-15 isoform X5 [Gopherus flavomarginatus]